MKNWDVLHKTALFSDITEAGATTLLTCLSAKEKSFVKGAYVYLMGDENCKPGVVLSGKLYLVKEDCFGNSTLMATLTPGSLFGEALVHTKDKTMPANLFAVTDCRVLFFDYEKIPSPCEKLCPCHTQFLKNLLEVISEKNKFLTQRIGHITKRSLREKICAYLSEERTRQNSDTVVIPYNRRELAEYLAADRSALSAELSRMQKEGMLTYDKNRFVLKSRQAFPSDN